jgi:hypothetical protein
MNDTSNYNPYGANDNTTIQRRRFPRRDHDVCMINVDGHPYPVVDWSMCGVLFEGDTRTFEEGQHINMILRFKAGSMIEDVKISGKIIRKKGRAIATQFADLPNKVEQTLNKIIDMNPAPSTKTVQI